jgi:hypothetical protein
MVSTTEPLRNNAILTLQAYIYKIVSLKYFFAIFALCLDNVYIFISVFLSNRKCYPFSHCLIR